MTELTNRYNVLEVCKDDIEKAICLFGNCYEKGGKLLVCGNGGSCADAGHIAGELMKGFMLKRKLSDCQKQKFSQLFGSEGEYIANRLQGALPVISLPDQTAVLTAFNNDVDASLGYAQLVWGYAQKFDALLCISTSGNSKNVVNAAKTAKIKGIKVVSLVGENKCLLDELSDVIIHVPESVTPNVQELHLPVYHYICEALEKRFFNEI